MFWFFLFFFCLSFFVVVYLFRYFGVLGGLGGLRVLWVLFGFVRHFCWVGFLWFGLVFCVFFVGAQAKIPYLWLKM